MKKKIKHSLYDLPKNTLKLLILFYRVAISPLISNRCRFYPTCSTYALDALKHYGFFKSFWLITKRLSCCHPFHSGGYDPLPILSKKKSSLMLIFIMLITMKPVNTKLISFLGVFLYPLIEKPNILIKHCTN